MVNVQKIKQKRFNAFRQGHINNLISKHIKLSRRDEGEIIYEDILVDNVLVAYFEYNKGNVNFVEIPCVEEKAV